MFNKFSSCLPRPYGKFGNFGQSDRQLSHCLRFHLGLRPNDTRDSDGRQRFLPYDLFLQLRNDKWAPWCTKGIFCHFATEFLWFLWFDSHHGLWSASNTTSF